jgi:LysR family glycine cleavage system transcriptional activator
VRRATTPSLGELTAFASAARHCSFSLAAVELSLTQSAISRLIRLLEDKLGVKLFERIKQRVVLTDAGRMFWRDVQSILTDIDGAAHRVRAVGEGTSALNLAVLTTFAARWLIPALPDFLAKHPTITINFAARVSPQDLALQPYDAAIHYGAPVWAGAFVHHLMDEEVLPVCSPAYKAKCEIEAPGDLVKAQLLQQLTRPAAWTAWFEDIGLDHPGSFLGHQFDHFGMAVQAAVAGLGVALVPRFLVTEDLRSKRLIVLFDHALKNNEAYFLVVPEQRAAAVRPFKEWIIEKAAEVHARQGAS